MFLFSSARAYVLPWMANLIQPEPTVHPPNAPIEGGGCIAGSPAIGGVPTVDPIPGGVGGEVDKGIVPSSAGNVSLGTWDIGGKPASGGTSLPCSMSAMN